MSMNEVKDPTSPLYTLSKFSSETQVKRGKEAMPMSIEKIDYEEGISEETKRTIRDYLATFYPGTQLKAVRFISKKRGKDVALLYVLNELGEMSVLLLGGLMLGQPELIFLSPLVHTENITLGAYLYAKKKGQKVSRKVSKDMNSLWNKMKKRGRWFKRNMEIEHLIDGYWR